eukprot:10019650-Heterocapsa_arctica.AAC.1
MPMVFLSTPTALDGTHRDAVLWFSCGAAHGHAIPSMSLSGTSPASSASLSDQGPVPKAFLSTPTAL